MIDEKKNTDIILTYKAVVFISIYYLFVFILGIYFSLKTLLFYLSLVDDVSNISNVLLLTILGSLGMSCIGSSIFYSRKIYKYCINSINLTSPEINFKNIKCLGSFFYYISRPLFSIGFSLLIIVGLLSGFMISSSNKIALTQGFIYINMFLSFFSGFSAGSMIRSLEKKGDLLIKKITKGEQE